MEHLYTSKLAKMVLRLVVALKILVGGKIGIRLIVIVSAIMFSLDVAGQVTFTSTGLNNIGLGRGEWRASTTWTTNELIRTRAFPSEPTDRVIIQDGHKVVIDQNESCGNLTVRPGGELTLNNTAVLNVVGVFTLQGNSNKRGSFITSANGTLKLAGAVDTAGNASFEAGSGTVEYIGSSAQNVASLWYHNLILAGAGNKSAIGDIVIRNNLTAPNRNFVPGTYTVTYSSNSPQNVAPIQYNHLHFTGVGSKAAAGDMLIYGNLTSDYDEFVSNGYKVTLNGQNQNVAGLQFASLEFANSGTKTAQGHIRVANDFTMNPGVAFAHNQRQFSYNGNGNQNVVAAQYHHLDLSRTGAKTAVGDISVSGNLSSSTTVVFMPNRRQVILNGADQDVAGLQFYRLVFSGTGVKKALGNIKVEDILDSSSETIFNHNNQLFTYNGGAQIIAPLSYYDLTLTGTGGKTAFGDITVLSKLRVENVIFSTDNKTLTLGPAAEIFSEENGTQHIKGIVETTRTVSLYPESVETFGNIGLRMKANEANLGSITVRRVTGKPFISPINSNQSVHRQFHVSSAGGLQMNELDGSIEMNFPDHDIPAPVANSYDMYRHTVVDGKDVIEKLANNSTSTSGFKYRLDNAQKFGMYTLSSNVVPLPVELVSFKAQRHAQGVSLTWATASEKDNSGFEVQVSADGKTFQTIGFVKSKVGTTSIRQDYSFLDTKAVSGTRYYRLVQIDLDGTTTYSAIRAVALEGGSGAVAAYPNPFVDVVMVKLNGVETRRVSVVMTNSLGKVVLEQQEETAGNTVTVNTAGLATKGVYLLHVIDSGAKHTFKLMRK
jgi:hypothetical protein